MMSLPLPPSRVSLPPPPLTISFAAPALTTTLPAPAELLSAPSATMIVAAISPSRNAPLSPASQCESGPRRREIELAHTAVSEAEDSCALLLAVNDKPPERVCVLLACVLRPSLATLTSYPHSIIAASLKFSLCPQYVTNFDLRKQKMLIDT